MEIIYGMTLGLLVVSFYKDPEKTKKALKIALKKFKKVMHPFFMMLIGVSVSLAIIPQEWIEKSLSGGRVTAVLIGSFLGSVVMMPGFVAFPLASILKESGVGYGTLAAFTTTLMMVGVLTFPVEQAYLGRRLALMRNITGYIIAMLSAFAIAVAYGEVHL